MLAGPASLPADDSGWAYEFKWDGVRAITSVEAGTVAARSRGAKDLTAMFPELQDLAGALGGRSAIVDGELVAFDAAGRPSFGRLQRRLNLTSGPEIASRAGQVPATYLIFDLLALDGESLLDLGYDERRDRLEGLALNGDTFTVPPVFRDARGADGLAAAAAAGLEGVLAKRRDSRYLPGERSPAWRKIKIVRTQDVVIGGWTDGEGERAGSLGALLLGVYAEPAGHGGLQYVGKVGTGFDAAARRSLLEALAPLASDRSPFEPAAGIPTGSNVHFVSPAVVGEVTYGEWTAGGHLRHPSWRGLRPEVAVGGVVREP